MTSKAETNKNNYIILIRSRMTPSEILDSRKKEVQLLLMDWISCFDHSAAKKMLQEKSAFVTNKGGVM